MNPKEFAANLHHVRHFVKAKHGDQKWAGLPYYEHLDRVAQEVTKQAAVLPIKFSPAKECELVIAAYLHDTLEDTRTTSKELKNLFGAQVTTLVQNVTDEFFDDKGEKLPNRKARKQATYLKTRKDRTAVFLKLCDRIVNVRQSLADDKFLDMYRKEQPDFKAMLRKRGEYDNLWNELDRMLGV